MYSFSTIDKEKTKRNVVELLNSYRTLARLADEEYLPNLTATYTFEPKSYTGTVNKAIENAVVKKVAAEREINKIVKAVNKLNQTDRQLIYDKFLDKRELSSTAIYSKNNISASSFYRELDKALIKFAEAYEYGKLLEEC